MKRLLISFSLLILCCAICIFGYYKVNSGANKLIGELNDAFVSIQEKQSDETILSKIEKCHETWDYLNTVFGIYLKHDAFNQIENIVTELKNSYKSNETLCAKEILTAIACLKNIIDQQKISVANLL